MQTRFFDESPPKEGGFFLERLPLKSVVLLQCRNDTAELLNVSPTYFLLLWVAQLTHHCTALCVSSIGHVLVVAVRSFVRRPTTCGLGRRAFLFPPASGTQLYTHVRIYLRVASLSLSSSSSSLPQRAEIPINGNDDSTRLMCRRTKGGGRKERGRPPTESSFSFPTCATMSVCVLARAMQRCCIHLLLLKKALGRQDKREGTNAAKLENSTSKTQQK